MNEFLYRAWTLHNTINGIEDVVEDAWRRTGRNHGLDFKENKNRFEVLMLSATAIPFVSCPWDVATGRINDIDDDIMHAAQQVVQGALDILINAVKDGAKKYPSTFNIDMLDNLKI